MTSFVGIVSQKGGVGKTTIAVNLGYALAKKGSRVLLVDSDLQGGLGNSLTEKSRDSHGFFDVLLNPGWEQAVGKFAIRTSLAQYELLTCGSREAMERFLSEIDGPWSSLDRIRTCRSALQVLGHDFVIFDTATGSSNLTMNICRTMDALLIPQQPGPLCLRSLPQMLRVLASLKKNCDAPALKTAGFVFSMTDPNDAQTREEQDRFREVLPSNLVFQTAIPKHTIVAEAARVGVPVSMLNRNQTGPAIAFDHLAAELENRISQPIQPTGTASSPHE